MASSDQRQQGKWHFNLVFWVILVVAAWLLGSWVIRTYIYERVDVTFEVFVTFEIQGQTYTGNAVWSGYQALMKFPTNAAVIRSVTGQAISLGGQSQDFFVLRRIQGSEPSRGAGFLPALCMPPSTRDGFDWLRYQFRAPCTLKSLPPAFALELVQITDRLDPSSIIPVSYDPLGEDAGCYNACLKEVRISPSDRPVDDNIRQLLPWLPEVGAQFSPVAQFGGSSSDSKPKRQYVFMDFAPYGKLTYNVSTFSVEK